MLQFASKHIQIVKTKRKAVYHRSLMYLQFNIHFTQKQIIISKSNLYEQQYEFNQIFDPQCDQEQIYLCVVNPIVTDALNGISSNLIIYGSQGSGKTYSLFGTIGSLFTLKQGLVSIESGIAIRMIHVNM
ncbi:unnamed protein product (macronuclear) [Paramecium tetraurelia]|uniref:Kinesin motor domain-containing protein n=1 Tax=Paramecium tetraurelia TaxID=5888 RepID=A0CR50_PARTE|nr:uncharacterized protein GSPATT00009581001 [Paramecium tetraurelia]CAK73267.1 unnamed protein product [Paramecium tetraurelia]|eukprot:XP_001440664.1 hypothetical protein (macronuclear) [Paramecium tetraurelia strain d4-2]